MGDQDLLGNLGSGEVSTGEFRKRGGRPSGAQRMSRRLEQANESGERLEKLKDEIRKERAQKRELERQAAEDRDGEIRRLLEPLVEDFGSRYGVDPERVGAAVLSLEKSLGDPKVRARVWELLGS